MKPTHQEKKRMLTPKEALTFSSDLQVGISKDIQLENLSQLQGFHFNFKSRKTKV